VNIVARLMAQAIRFGTVRPIEGATLYGRNLVRAFEQKYGFMESPQTVADFDLSKGISFSHGYFENRMVIDKFRIYNNGVVVETKETTDDCVRIISDITAWGAEKGGVLFEENTSSPELYLSHFEVEMAVDLQGASRKFQTISEQINRYMSSYKEIGRDFRLSTMSFQLDPLLGGPTSFKFERRNGKSFAENLYFSSAPLKSQDHVSLLAAIETAFTP
jgi:hypothetical protein